MRENNGVIHLRGMEFYAYHGMLEEEMILGQKFIIDVDLYPAKWINDSDNIEDTINYAQVYTVVQECIQRRRFKLIESLAEAIATNILEEFHCLKIRVEVHKPNAPIPGLFRDISVEIIREKKI